MSARTGRQFPARARLLQPRQVLVPVGAVASGTVIAADKNEGQIVAGGQTIIIDVGGTVWVAAGATFDAARADIIQGLDSAQAEATGWNAEVRDKEVVGAVVRTSDTRVTITLSASAAFNITAPEVITVTIPASAIITGSPLIATPTFQVIPTKPSRPGKLQRPTRYFTRIGV